jgi:hypothetical protein
MDETSGHISDQAITLPLVFNTRKAYDKRGLYYIKESYEK